MGILHRVYARHAPEVWEAETRLLHAMRLVRRPVAVQWLVTAACDLKCPHCYSEAGRRGGDELTTDEARRLLLDELVALGKPMLVLAGGELLLRKDIPELVAEACARGLPWAMHTHGLHVPRFRELFQKYPPALAAISLDGDRETHDLFRGRRGSFDGALEAMRVLKEEGCGEVVAGTTVTRLNADRVAELFPVVQASAADSWGLHLFAPEGRGAEHLDLLPTPEQLRKVAAFAREARRSFHVELCNEWGGAGEDDPHYRDQPFLCGAGRISCVISPGGEVLPCTTTDLRESEGNVRSTPLRQIWSRRFVRFRRGGHGACSEGGECWLQARNGVRCSQDAFGPAAGRSSLAPTLLDRLPPPPPEAEVGLASERAARLVRAAALAAVVLEATSAKIRSLPREDLASLAQQASDFPAITVPQVERHLEATRPGSPWRSLLNELVAGNNQERARKMAQQLGAGLSKSYLTHVERRASLQADTLAQLQGLLEAAESHVIFDPVLVDYLWLRTRDLPLEPAAADAAALARFYGRLGRHLRIAEALGKAKAAAGPVAFGAWRSKAGPPAGQGRSRPEDLLAAARKAYPDATASAFTRPGAVAVTLEKGTATLVRPGGPRKLTEGTQVTVERLDLLRTASDCAFRHDEVGMILVKAGSQATAYSLQRRLAPEAVARIDAWIALAAQEDAAALAKLRASSGLVSLRIARFLEATPEAPGAPALRAIVTTP